MPTFLTFTAAASFQCFKVFQSTLRINGLISLEVCRVPVSINTVMTENRDFSLVWVISKQHKSKCGIPRQLPSYICSMQCP